ncbi:hypothetical protein CYMTET_51063 [Cymbomonas tetramitiformis]|uniref:Uncharacterized protein n=1 Tax=Cymbomonas tetramitiformis TaxID=36881 RepID=A0AAE0BLW0_9CHLO|nr:hypothetical protein CYMTET_51063 [Cymbomonas tetramitiformis]
MHIEQVFWCNRALGAHAQDAIVVVARCGSCEVVSGCKFALGISEGPLRLLSKAATWSDPQLYAGLCHFSRPAPSALFSAVSSQGRDTWVLWTDGGVGHDNTEGKQYIGECGITWKGWAPGAPSNDWLSLRTVEVQAAGWNGRLLALRGHAPRSRRSL